MSAHLSRPEFLPGSSPEAVFKTLKKRGAVLLRQILPSHLLTNLLPLFKQGFAAEDRLYISGQMRPEIYQNFYYYGHAEPNQIANYYAWITSLLQEGALKRVLQAIYGSEVYMLVNKSFPGRQDPAQPVYATPLHQDQEFTGPFGSGLNLWLPLTPVGNTYPTLELCLDGPQRPLLQVTETSEQRQKLLQDLGLSLWRVEMQPGDALLFTGFTLHQTCLTESMTEIRYSTEVRLVSAAEKQVTQAALLAIDLS